jgi:hypothetical protein
MEALWPGSDRRAASNSLRSTLHAARKVLDSSRGERYLASEDDSILLCPGGELWVDVDGFEDAAATARRSQDPAGYRAALDLCGGELLPEDRYEEWAEGRREELRHTWSTLGREEGARLSRRGGLAGNSSERTRVPRSELALGRSVSGNLSADFIMYRCTPGPLRVIKDTDIVLTTFGLSN